MKEKETTLILCRKCEKGFRPVYMRWSRNGGCVCKECYQKEKMKYD